MSERLAPGLWQLGPKTASGECGSIYLARHTAEGEPAEEEWALFDTGPAELVLELEEELWESGIDIRTHKLPVILTHGHSDHAGAAAVLQAAYPENIDVFVGSGDLEATQTGDYNGTAGVFYHKKSLPIPNVQPLSDGQSFSLGETDIVVHETPGHSPGSVTIDITPPQNKQFPEAMRIALLGDNGWGGWHEDIGSDLAAWKNSTDKLLELSGPPTTDVSFGHGPTNALVPNGRQHLQQLRQQIGMYGNAYDELPAEYFNEATARPAPDLGSLVMRLTMQVKSRQA